MVGALVWHTAVAPGRSDLKLGVYTCAAILCVLVVARQVVALLENARLNDQLAAHTAVLEQRNAELQALLAKNDELAAVNAQLAEMANIDPLTGLATRSLLHDQAAQALRAQQRDGLPLALLLMDLQRFKEINDRFGPAVK